MQRAGGHQRKGRARRGMLPLGVSFWDGAGWGLQPGGRGACLSFRPGGCLVPWWKRRGGLWGAPSGGHRTDFLPFSAWGPDPPWCSTDPASPTAALQKGLCWGVCRLYPGLRGCVRRRKKERGAESCCLLLKRLERCEGTRKKARHGERGVLLLRWWCSSLPPPCKAWGGL